MDGFAKDIMSLNPLTATETMTVEDALKLLVNNKITGLPVVDERKKLVGVVSEYDIITQVSAEIDRNPDIFKATVAFSRNPIYVAEDAPFKDVVELFVSSKARRLPVVNAELRVKGIISRRDLMRVFYYRARFANE